MQVEGQDALDLKAGTYSWLTIGGVLEREEIFVPQIHSLLKDSDAILIEDFGDTTLDLKVTNLNNEEIHNLYSNAAETISKFLSIQPDLVSSWPKRGFDYALLHRELEFFKSQFLDSFPEFQTQRESTHFSKEIDSLCRYIGKFPQYFTHRDFHSRNLMYFQKKLGVIDFQDARWGPAAYDLCSLCFDPYVPLELGARTYIFSKALSLIAEENIRKIRDEIEESWQAVCLQRFLKAIGSFAFLTRKGKRDYRIYIAPTLTLLKDILPPNTQWPYLVDELIPRLLKLSNEKAA